MDLNVQPVQIIRDELTEFVRGFFALLPNIVAAVVIVLVTWFAAVVLARLVRTILRRSDARPSLHRALASLVSLAVWIAGVLVAMAILFPDLTPSKVLAGLGIGSILIGLAFKDIFENYLAGLMILLRKPMRIGDDIECGDVVGQVEEITIRDTYIRKRSDELILVPNSFIYKNPTVVLTDRPFRRIELVVGIAYGEDVAAGRTVIRGAMESVESVDQERGVDVFARQFGSSSIDFLVRWWTPSSPLAEHSSRDEVVAAIKRALDEAGIEIPFPYRTLTFKEPLRVETDRPADPSLD